MANVQRVLRSMSLIPRTNFIGCMLSKAIHTTTVTMGVRNPAQNKIIKAHADYYNDYWSHDLESWSEYNDMLYPPSQPGDPHRPAEIYHGRALIRYSPKKMWYMTKLVMNKNVDEAIGHMKFVNTKGARIISEILLEAQEMAVKDHNVEYKSNLHVAASFVLPAGCRKIIKFHGKGYANMNRSRFCNYYVMLREGQSPEWQPRTTAYSAAVEYIDRMRRRNIRDGL